MSNQKPNSQDILAHLRNGNNRYIHQNAVANLPGAPNSSQSLSSSLQIHTTAHIANQIPNAHKWPAMLNKSLHIIKLKKANENASDRLTICNLESRNEPLAIRDVLNVTMGRLRIMACADDWSFGYCINGDKSFREIVSYNCRTDNIIWDEFSHFVLREQQSLEAPSKSPKSRSKSEKNKSGYKVKNSMMDTGADKLKEMLDKSDYELLTKNTRLFIEAKYKAGIERLPDEEVVAFVMKRLYGDNKQKKVHNNMQVAVAKPTSDPFQDQMKMMMNMMMIQMMGNMSKQIGHPSIPNQNSNNMNNGTVALPQTAVSVPSLAGIASEPKSTANTAYGPSRGTTTNTNNSRFTPIARSDTIVKLPLPKL